MFENIKNMFNGEASKEEYEEKKKEVEKLKEEADESSGELKSEMVEEEDYSLRRVVQEYVPSEAEGRYKEAVKKLKEMKDKRRDNAERLNNAYDSLIEERNNIIEKIAEEENKDQKQGLIQELGRKNKEIKKFEKEKIDIS